MDFAKYYDLEKYIFGEVRDNFFKRRYLTAEEFFCIIIWKANRSKTTTKERLMNINKNLDTAVKEITNKIYKAKSDRKKLKIFLEDYGFRLPTASAILTVLYPKSFTIYDVRVRNEIKMEKDISRKSDKEKVVNLYFNEYLKKVKSVQQGRTLRDKDKYLWGKSFYNALEKLTK